MGETHMFNSRLESWALLVVLFLPGCDGTPDVGSANSNHFGFLQANQESAFCSPSSTIDPTVFAYDWDQIGEPIHGSNPSPGSDHYDALEFAVGFGVEISRDGKRVVSLVGEEISRSYFLNENGLEQS